MIDVEAYECAVQTDYDRAMVVSSLEGGSKGVNVLVSGVVVLLLSLQPWILSRQQQQYHHCRGILLTCCTGLDSADHCLTAKISIHTTRSFLAPWHAAPIRSPNLALQQRSPYLHLVSLVAGIIIPHTALVVVQFQQSYL
jgi:hypothetical protein